MTLEAILDSDDDPEQKASKLMDLWWNDRNGQPDDMEAILAYTIRYCIMRRLHESVSRV